MSGSTVVANGIPPAGLSACYRAASHLRQEVCVCYGPAAGVDDPAALPMLILEGRPSSWRVVFHLRRR